MIFEGAVVVGEIGERNTEITSLAVKVLGILKTFFQEGFKRGSGQRPAASPTSTWTLMNNTGATWRGGGSGGRGHRRSRPSCR